MTEAYPVRRAELDTYQNDIIDMATRFPSAFYEYHKAFSARAAAMLANNNLKIDWASRDTTMYCSIFAGHRASACTVCSSLTHSAPFCPQTFPSQVNRPGTKHQSNSRLDNSLPTSDVRGRPRVVFQGKEICNNFNATGGCTRLSCTFCHMCSICKSRNHPAFLCKRSHMNAQPYDRSKKDHSDIPTK